MTQANLPILRIEHSVIDFETSKASFERFDDFRVQSRRPRLPGWGADSISGKTPCENVTEVLVETV